MIFDRVVKVERLTNDVSNSDKEGYTLIVSSAKANIHPASEETVVMYEGSFGETFDMYSTPTLSGILKGDRITTISGVGVNDAYIVKGVSDQSKPPMPHMKFVLFKAKPNQNE